MRGCDMEKKLRKKNTFIRLFLQDMYKIFGFFVGWWVTSGSLDFVCKGAGSKAPRFQQFL